MRLRQGTLARAALFALILALALPGVALGAEPVFEKYKVPSVGGAEINVEVMRPADNPDAPVILTYSPYNTLSETTTPNLANDDLGQRYVPMGYARAVADVDGTTKTVSRGFLNLQYRNGLAVAEPIPPNQPIQATVTFKPQDQLFEAGHRIGVIVQGSNTVWALPDDPGASYTVNGSALLLPLS